MNIRLAVWPVLVLLALIGCQHSEIKPVVDSDAPKIAAFSKQAQFIDAKISTHGKYIALLVVDQGRRGLAFIERASGKVVFRFQDVESMVGSYWWANDERVVIQLVDLEGALIAQPFSRGEIYAVDATGRGGKMIFGYRAGGETYTHFTHLHQAENERASGWLVSTLRHDPDHVLIGATDWHQAGDRTIRLYKLDVNSGVKTLVTVAPTPNAGFLVDEDGEPRVAVGRDEKYRPLFFYRGPSESWRELTTLKGLTEDSRPLHFVAQDHTLMVAETIPDGFGLFAYNVDTGDKKLVSKNELVPPWNLLTDRANDRVIAVEYQPDLPVTDVLDPQHPLNKLVAGVEQTFPGERVEIASRTIDSSVAILHVYSDRDPGQYLVADIAKSAVEKLVDVRPWIKPDEMAEMNAFHIPASDGVRIHGFITLPRSPATGPHPMVVLPHGGPHGIRDTWGFNPEAQLLASEGFAVLQVNYRGSGGYGLAFQEAGYRKWGTRIMDDIIDATQFAIRKGYADPHRICIYGGSFGGYAALQGAVVAPDLFRCAVGYAGVYDLTREINLFLGRLRETHSLSNYAKEALGDDPKELQATSPAFHADKVKAHVLLIHGGKDRVAVLAHAEAMRSALIEKGNPPEWLYEPKEAHGFYDEGARERMYAHLVSFLKENTAAP